VLKNLIALVFGECVCKNFCIKTREQVKFPASTQVLNLKSIQESIHVLLFPGKKSSSRRPKNLWL
jgi:Mg2+/Co2+ transporter CorB